MKKPLTIKIRRISIYPPPWINYFRWFCLLLIFLASSANSLQAQINSNEDGSWNSEDTWLEAIPTATDNAVVGHVVTIPVGFTAEVHDLTINSKLTVEGTLIIYGNLETGNNSQLIANSGSIIILGNGNLSNIVTLTLDDQSYFIVKGDFDKDGAHNQGNLTITSAHIYILGNVSVPYFKEEPWQNFSVCSSGEYDGTTVTEEDDCDAGQLDDFVDNVDPEELPNGIYDELVGCDSPTATISGDADICEGGSTNLSVALTGTQPWSITYTDGTTPVTVNNITSSPHTIIVTPSATTTYTLTEVSDANCTGTTSGSATVTVNPLPAEPSLTSNSPVCPGADAVFTISGTPLNEVTYSGAASGTATIGAGGTAEVIVAGVTSDVTMNLTEVRDGTCTRTLSGLSEIVVVEDNEAPVPDIATLPDITAECEITTLTAPTAIDNCSGTVTGTQNASLPISSQGTTEVTWTFDDGNGNISTQTQNVVIEDVTNPEITCPSNVTVTVDENQCTATGVVLGTPVTGDNCGVASLTNDATVPFPIGDNTVTWSVEDIAGNTASCEQTVTITPEEIIDIQVAELGDFCQSGETGSATEIIWQVNLLAGTNNWTFDYTINDGTSDVATGTGVAATGNTTVTYSLTNETAVHKTLTLTITNLADACGVGESNTTNNSDSVTAFGVPDTSDITTN